MRLFLLAVALLCIVPASGEISQASPCYEAFKAGVEQASNGWPNGQFLQSAQAVFAAHLPRLEPRLVAVGPDYAQISFRLLGDALQRELQQESRSVESILEQLDAAFAIMIKTEPPSVAQRAKLEAQSSILAATIAQALQEAFSGICTPAELIKPVQEYVDYRKCMIDAWFCPKYKLPLNDQNLERLRKEQVDAIKRIAASTHTEWKTLESNEMRQSCVAWTMKDVLYTISLLDFQRH